MNTIVALLRGINVGGRHLIKMPELVQILDSLELQQCLTYIQSGNVVFQTEITDLPALALAISDNIEAIKGFRPTTMLFSADDFRQKVLASPFKDLPYTPDKSHLFFLDRSPESPNIAQLEALKAESEVYSLTEDMFYLYAPDGIGRSKLCAKVEKLLGVPTTARNWRTVTQLLSLI